MPTQKTKSNTTAAAVCLGESGWPGGGEDLLGADLGDAVGQGEGQVLAEELLDVGALDIVGLLELDDTEDLERLMLVISHIHQWTLQRFFYASFWLEWYVRGWT